MSGCNHDCEHCQESSSCSSKIEKAKLNERSHIKKVVGVLSGKGGVGKSFITSYLAVSLRRQGYKVGILDADITGPSIPKAFGITERAYGEDSLIYPATTRGGIKIISSNLLLENDNEPIIWRGTLLANLVKQFYEDVLWEELDYLLIDMPPGTGDITLTSFQILPIDYLIIVTSPQSLVSMIVTKAVKMAEMMNIKVLGLVENMSYISCPSCQEKIYLYGQSLFQSLTEQLHVKPLARLPLINENALKIDQGKIEEILFPEFDPIVDAVIKGE